MPKPKTRRITRRYRKRGGARFFHYSAKPIHQLRDLSSKEVGKLIKPNGLWFSEDDSWKEWCNESGCFNVSGAHKYEANIDLSKLFVIDTNDKLTEFQERFFSPSKFKIDWPKVSKEYAGIQFTNYAKVKNHYQNHFSPEILWFMAVDIDSVCIWRPSQAILSFTQIN
jgi:hypothetical protein